jgi:hypothetical protein
MAVCLLKIKKDRPHVLFASFPDTESLLDVSKDLTYFSMFGRGSSVVIFFQSSYITSFKSSYITTNLLSGFAQYLTSKCVFPDSCSSSIITRYVRITFASAPA